METLKIGDRIFKLCEDVPLAVKEKRKLFWINNKTPFELRCVSENFGPTKDHLFLYDNGNMGEGFLLHYRNRDPKYNYNLYFDVTPEKRYAIWNSYMGRFIVTTGHGLSTFPYRSRAEAQADIDTYNAKHPANKMKLTVVEFDNPDAE